MNTFRIDFFRLFNLRNLNNPPSHDVPVLPERNKGRIEPYSTNKSTWNATFPIEKIERTVTVLRRSLKRHLI